MGIMRTLVTIVDSGAGQAAWPDDDKRIDLWRIWPFIALHGVAIWACTSMPSLFAVGLCIALFWIRMVGITGVYHRLLAHRSYRANRFWTFIGAFIANSSSQRGPLWWAAHHRDHHKHSDQPGDAHSPNDGFWHSHCLWFLTRGAYRTRTEAIPDLMKFPELLFLDRFDWIAPLTLAAACYGLGEFVSVWQPTWGTSGVECLLWGFVVSTVANVHATFTINSLAHRWGSRPYATKDDSRNNFWLALITCGEGWHNNHHYFQSAARQGFRWWEFDQTFLVLRFLSLFRIVHGLRGVPDRVMAARGSGAEMPAEDAPLPNIAIAADIKTPVMD